MALGHRFTVRADDVRVLGIASDLFGSLADTHTAETSETAGGVGEALATPVTYSIRSRAGRRLGASRWRDDQLVRLAPDVSGAADRLAWVVNGAAVGSELDGLILHAAAVARDGRVVVLAGESGAGKSTLAAGLAIRGFDYLGDEVTVVDAALGVRGMPRAAKLSPRSLEAIGLDASSGIPLGRDVHVMADRLRPGSARTSGALAAVVLPRYRPGARGSIERLGPIAAVTALLPCVFGARSFTQAEADVLGAIVTGVPVHRIEVGDARTAEAFVTSLLTSPVTVGVASLGAPVRDLR